MSLRWKLLMTFALSASAASAQCSSGLDLGVVKITCVKDGSQTSSVRWRGPITGVLNFAGNSFEVKANSINELPKVIQDHVKDAVPALETKGLDSKLVVKGTSQDNVVTGELSYKSVRVPLAPTFTLQLAADQKAMVSSALLNGDDQFDLAKTDQQWPQGFPMVRIRINMIPTACTQKNDFLLSDGQGCYAEALLAILSDHSDIVVAMQVQSDGLRVHNAALKDEGLVYTVNDREIKAAATDPIFPAAGPQGWTVNRYRTYDGCRFYDRHLPFWVTLASPPGARTEGNSKYEAAITKSNGITVGAAKVFDVAALQRMLLDTANQLAAVSGFNAGTITAALTNIQGTTRNASFISAQATGSPTPSIATTASSVGGPNSTVTASPGTPTPQTVTVQCPDGTLPSLATNGAFGCTIPTSPPSASTTSAPYTVTTTPSTAPTTTTTTAGTPAVTNTINTTTPSVTPIIPTQPASTAPAPPTSNLGLSSADLLGDEVELNAEITTLRLLLQGALSDQYLLKNSRAVESRQQTTIGFAVALDPPETRKPAVAEVRVYVVTPKGADPVSIMNLMPADKTYNVATVTGLDRSFGFAIALPFVQVGLNAGNSKDQLYLVKDTDTVALQFPSFPDGQPSAKPPAPNSPPDKEQRGKKGKNDTPVSAESVGMPIPCRPPVDPGGTNTVVFGWQFRPVLGADYVRSGRRQVFAQLALPGGSETTGSPRIFLQTVWREYNKQTQVVGDAIDGTCRWDSDSSATSLVDQPVVRDMSMSDLGGGQAKLTARGDFFSTSLSVLSGSNTSVPLAFDGKDVEVFGAAHDLLENGDLRIVGANGRNSPFAIKSQEGKSCGIASAKLIATPRSDGNSLATLELALGEDYNPEKYEDGMVNPLVLIGKQVYGIREYPFLIDDGEEPCEKKGEKPAKCTYRFLAPTADIRNAESFLARDLTWQNMSATGRIEFLPSFTTITKLSADPGPDDKKPDKTTYLVSGYDFDRLPQPCDKASESQPCLTITATGQDVKNFKVLDRNFATFDLAASSGSGTVKSVQFELQTAKDKLADSVLWNLTLPATAAAAKVTASPTFLKQGDSQKVSFSGVVLKGLADKGKATVKFEACDLSSGSVYHANSNSLDVIITTCVTSKMGHKEISATNPNSTADAVTLTIDIVRQ
jgi:hypothetical protein